MTVRLARYGTMVIKLGYRGMAFSGFAEQPGQRTVAGEMRRALETILRHPVELECAGRTDAGVHALAQYISLPVTADELTQPGRRLVASLVALTPDDIAIRAVFRARPGFSARFEALSRQYRYRIVCGPARPVMAAGHAWWLRGVDSLDLDAMNRAAHCLIGEHDFRSFCKATSADLLTDEGRSTSRYIAQIQAHQIEEAGEQLIAIDVVGNAFLHNMVRIIVGTLVDVGRGHREISWVAAALASRDRACAGPTAPAEGLTFEAVEYPANSLSVWT